MTKRRVVRIGATLAVAAGVVAVMAGPAQAHHVFLDFEATGDLVPGGGGDPDGTAMGVIDFNSEQSPDVCIDGTAENLDEIDQVAIVAKDDGSVLLAFEPGTLESCVEATDEQREALHDFADDYLLVIATAEFGEGAVAGDLVEQEHSTTTSSSVPEASTTTPTAATVAATAAAATSPNFTG